MKILGIDPGSRFTGYGLIEQQGRMLGCISHGVISLPVKEEYGIRLVKLYESLQIILERFCPDVVALEKIFFSKNARSAIQLGQARGVILLAANQKKIPLFEYSPALVKARVTRYGVSSKEQVADAVKLILGLEKNQTFKTVDASDALALAICHAFTVPQSSGLIKPLNVKRARQSIADSVRHRTRGV